MDRERSCSQPESGSDFHPRDLNPPSDGQRLSNDEILDMPPIYESVDKPKRETPRSRPSKRCRYLNPLIFGILSIMILIFVVILVTSLLGRDDPSPESSSSHDNRVAAGSDTQGPSTEQILLSTVVGEARQVKLMGTATGGYAIENNSMTESSSDDMEEDWDPTSSLAEETLDPFITFDALEMSTTWSDHDLGSTVFSQRSVAPLENPSNEKGSSQNGVPYVDPPHPKSTFIMLSPPKMNTSDLIEMTWYS